MCSARNTLLFWYAQNEEKKAIRYQELRFPGKKTKQNPHEQDLFAFHYMTSTKLASDDFCV